MDRYPCGCWMAGVGAVVVVLVLGAVLAFFRLGGQWGAIWLTLALVGLGTAGLAFWALDSVVDGNPSPKPRPPPSQTQWSTTQEPRKLRDQREEAGQAVCVYFIENSTGHVKIGSSTDPHRRIKALQTGNSELLTLAWTGWFNNERAARACEETLHRRLANRHVRGEWFRAAGLDYARLLNEVSRTTLY